MMKRSNHASPFQPPAVTSLGPDRETEAAFRELSSSFAAKLTALDRLLIGYTAFVGLFIAFHLSEVRRPAELLALHIGIIALILLLPAKGASWESRTPGESLLWRAARQGLRFLRYMFPLGLVIFYFEEVRYFVNALWADSPYWFEPYLLGADRLVFGGSPGVLVEPFVGMPQDEIMHFFYFSYYLVVLGGGALAYIGMPPSKKPPAPGFETAITSVTAAFLFAFVWYPYLPARGPWENAELMEGLTSFQGIVFTSWIETIIAHGAVSGGCFPSGHVAGTFGMSFGLLPHYPRAGSLSLFLAIGMAAACLYTRYHHGPDILAGLACAGLGYAFARRVVRQRSSPVKPQHSP